MPIFTPLPASPSLDLLSLRLGISPNQQQMQQQAAGLLSATFQPSNVMEFTQETYSEKLLHYPDVTARGWDTGIRLWQPELRTTGKEHEQ